LNKTKQNKTQKQKRKLHEKQEKKKKKLSVFVFVWTSQNAVQNVYWRVFVASDGVFHSGNARRTCSENIRSSFWSFNGNVCMEDENVVNIEEERKTFQIVFNGRWLYLSFCFFFFFFHTRGEKMNETK
jgi:hypothetical protein